MGSKPAEQKASGAITTQGAILPQDITKGSQNAFRSTLPGVLGDTRELTSGATVGRFNPGDPFSSRLSPLVSGAVSRQVQDNAGMVHAQNQRLVDALGGNPANQALLTSLQNENNMANALDENAIGLDALEQQRQYDLEGENIAQNRFNLNRQAALDEFNTQMAGNQAYQGLFRTLGEGLISTSPNQQISMTVDDLNRLRSNPDLLKYYPTGALGPQINAATGGSGPIQGLANPRFANAPAEQRQYYVNGRGWTLDGENFSNGLIRNPAGGFYARS